MQSIEKRVDDLFSLWLQNPGAGGQLVVVHKGETILERCYGYANIEKQIPMTQDSVFAVASVSKQITAMSIMILHDRGVLNIADDIRKYIPDLVKFEEKVTISQMLHHTSGIRECFELTYLGQKEGDGPLTQDYVRSLIAKQEDVNFAPGTEFVYCNSGYLYLATIVERLTGMTLGEFAKKNIFEPLGMSETFFVENPELPPERLVTSYHDDGYNYTACPANSKTYGSGGMRSICRDMVKFMPQYKNPTLVSRETMEQLYLQIPPLEDGKGTVTNYACGVRINDLEGHRYFHHGGVTAAFRTFTVIFPDDDLVIAVFTNTYNIPIETAGRDIARIVLGLPERKRHDLDAYTTEEVDLDAIAGNYMHDVSGTLYSFRVQDGQVFVSDKDAWIPLVKVRGNLYKMGRRNISFAFGETIVVNQEEAVRKLRKLSDEVPAGAADCIGTYYCAEVDGTFGIVMENGQLWLEHPKLARQLLVLLEGETYCYGPLKGKRRIRIQREDGVVTGMFHETHQTRGTLFVKK